MSRNHHELVVVDGRKSATILRGLQKEFVLNREILGQSFERRESALSLLAEFMSASYSGSWNVKDITVDDVIMDLTAPYSREPDQSAQTWSFPEMPLIYTRLPYQAAERTMTDSSLAIDVSKVSGHQRVSIADSVAIEEPLEIQLSNPSAEGAAAKSVSITMRTPGDDAELAVGFLFTEGIIQSGEQLASVEHCGAPAPESGLRNIIRVELKSGVDVDLGRLQRHFYTTSSCGVCGKASLDALRVTAQAPLADKSATFRRDVIVALPDRLRTKQQVFAKTGGLHAAAVFDQDGEILFVKEDVGRHNAVDKVVGALLLKDMLPANELGLIVSGRASFELIQKTLVAGIPLLAAISAPSSLAVQTAREFNMTLIGFLRNGKFNIYSGAQRVD